MRNISTVAVHAINILQTTGPLHFPLGSIWHFSWMLHSLFKEPKYIGQIQDAAQPIQHCMYQKKIMYIDHQLLSLETFEEDSTMLN